MNTIESWGRMRAPGQGARAMWWRSEALPLVPGRAALGYGLGRSYGDSCLNAGGDALLTRHLDRFIAFDPATGLLRCEAGVSLDEILTRFVPRGFFPPVVPGTKFVTVGGAVANDIHGKNHHREGTFGRHVTRLGLLRSDGREWICSPTENAELFSATVGGLGLTGLISWVEVRLRSIPGPFIDWETVPFRNVEAFFDLSAASDRSHEYTVAWIDCLARGDHLGRGLFYRGNHTPEKARAPRHHRSPTVPFDFPGFALNHLSVKAFNTLYHLKGRLSPARRVVHYEPFFFPLDGVEKWNRIYGKQGLLQFQCVVPFENGTAGISAVLEGIAASGQGSFLAVLKTFGDVPSPGMMSFPRRGVTVALDFPNRGERTFELFRRLEALVLQYGGAMYPAKDALMSPAMFEASFPRVAEFERHVDPRFSSSFWRRVRKSEVQP